MDGINVRESITAFFRKYRYALLILLIGLVLMWLPEGESAEQELTVTEEAEKTVELEQRLEEILSQIEGAGKVSVLLTVRSGESVVYQTDEDSNVTADSSDMKLDTVIITDSDRAEQGLIRQVNPPVYLGAVVVCQGANSAAVKLAIVEAVSNATGLGADKITVLKMK